MKTSLINTVLLSALSLLLFLSACSDTPPEIVQSYTQPNILRHPETAEIGYQYSVFLHLEDEDGIDDIESIFIIHDEGELFWELSSDNWVTVTEENATWIGSNGIAFPGTEPPARGSLRIIVIDAAGDRTTEEVFFQPPPADSRLTFPRLESGEEGSLLIRSTHTQHTLWYYDSEGGIVESYKTEDRRIFPTHSEEDIATIYLYAYSNEHGCGLVSGPYPYPGQ